MQPFLDSENIYLRALNPKDAEGDYANWFNDAEVCRYNSHHVFPYLKESALSYINKINSSRDNLVLAIIEKSTNKHIGNISLQNINLSSRNAEYAIIIGDKTTWGKGYSKEASLLILRHGFIEMNLHRIYCGTSAENIPMQKLAAFLGMELEGRRKEAFYKSGKYLDILEYGILKDTFLTKFKG